MSAVSSLRSVNSQCSSAAREKTVAIFSRFEALQTMRKRSYAAR